MQHRSWRWLWILLLCGWLTFLAVGSSCTPPAPNEPSKETITDASEPRPEPKPEPRPEPRPEPEPVQEVIPEPKPDFPVPPGCNNKHECQFDTDCKEGEYCVEGKCSKETDCPAGERCNCRKDADCQLGKAIVCDKGTCVEITCSNDCNCGPQHYCSDAGSCARCKATCSKDSDCKTGEKCQSYGFGCSRCVEDKKKDYGSKCKLDSECKGGLCIGTFPGDANGRCSRPCSKPEDCPVTNHCVKYPKELCNEKNCSVCLETRTIGCSSFFTCKTDKDCKGLQPVCSCCNDWKCNANNRCQPVFF